MRWSPARRRFSILYDKTFNLLYYSLEGSDIQFFSMRSVLWLSTVHDKSPHVRYLFCIALFLFCLIPSSFRRCLNNLIDDVNTRMEKDQSAARGGLIVNGGSWYEEDRSFPLLKEMIDRLDIGAVFVLHDGRIYV